MLWVSAGTNKWKREMALATQSRRECPLRARVCALKIVRLREWHGHGWKWDATSKCVTSDASTLTLFACSLSLYISWTYFFIYFFCDFETMLRWWWYGLCRADDITEANKQNTKRNCGIKDEKMEQRTNAQWQSFANAGRHILFLAILLFISPHSNPSNNKEWRKKVDRKKIAAAVVACSAKSLMDRCMDGSHQKFCLSFYFIFLEMFFRLWCSLAFACVVMMPLPLPLPAVTARLLMLHQCHRHRQLYHFLDFNILTFYSYIQ